MCLGDIGEAGAAQKTFDRLFIGARARALAVLAHIGGAGVETADVERQAARRPVFAGTLIGQASLDQRVGQKLLQIAGSLALQTGRDFLGAEFKQKIGHGRMLFYGTSGLRRT